MQSREIIADVTSRIVERTAPDRIILYGSHARGEAGAGSDIDLLVLFDRLDDRRQMVSELYRAARGCPLPKDLVAATTAEFERYRGVVNTIHNAVGSEGEVLYERHGA